MRDYSSFGGRYSVGVACQSRKHSLVADNTENTSDGGGASTELQSISDSTRNITKQEEHESPPKRHRVWQSPPRAAHNKSNSVTKGDSDFRTSRQVNKRYSMYSAPGCSVTFDTADGSSTQDNSASTLTEAHLLEINKEYSYDEEDTENENVSDCGTDVAKLRSKLQNFGQQQKEHFLKVNGKPEPSSLTKPTRPRVSRNGPGKAPPTPLPPPVAQVLQRRLSIGNTKKSVFHQQQNNSKVVQATNEGYASVAKLSAWLADDPTKTRRPKVLRRGANVITKSRAFDKGLANAICQETYLRSGHVADKVSNNEDICSEVGSSHSDSHSSLGLELGAASIAVQNNSIRSSSSCDSGSHGSLGSCQNSSFSGNVSDKKQWLASAFKKAKSASDDEEDEDDNVTASKAKELWRSRTQRHQHVPTPLQKMKAPALVSVQSSSALSVNSGLTNGGNSTTRGVATDVNENQASARPEEVEAPVENVLLTPTKTNGGGNDSRRSRRSSLYPPLLPSRSIHGSFSEDSQDTQVTPKEKQGRTKKNLLNSTKSLALESLSFPDNAKSDDGASNDGSAWGFEAARRKLLKRSQQNGHEITVHDSSAPLGRNRRFSSVSQNI